MAEIRLRRVTEADWEQYRALRLEGLLQHPTAFGSDYPREAVLDEAAWRDRLRRGATSSELATWVAEADGQLVATSALMRRSGIKNQHYATLVAVYVAPDWRGHGLTGRLFDALLEWAREVGIERINLAVMSANAPAIAVYLRKGFAVYGVERDALRIDGVSYDELLMDRTV